MSQYGKWKYRSLASGDNVVDPMATESAPRERQPSPSEPLGRALAAVLGLLAEGHAILGRDLRRDPPLIQGAALHVAHRQARVLQVVPMRRVERVGVAEDPLDPLGRRQLAVAAEEPDPVALDGPAERDAAVVRIDDAPALHDADAAQ